MGVVCIVEGNPVRGQTFGHVGGWEGLRRVRVRGRLLVGEWTSGRR